jgi:hypothetical protein
MCRERVGRRVAPGARSPDRVGDRRRDERAEQPVRLPRRPRRAALHPPGEHAQEGVRDVRGEQVEPLKPRTASTGAAPGARDALARSVSRIALSSSVSLSPKCA